MTSKPKTFTFKIVIIGDYAVGKTSLLRNFTEHYFSFDYKPSIGANITVKEFKLPENKGVVYANFWDIAGQELFSNLRNQFYEGTDACAIVYDCTRKETFANVKIWHRNVTIFEKRLKPDNIVLLANKVDLKDQRVVSSEDSLNLAKELGVQHYETSALTSQNVSTAFNYLISNLMQERGNI